MGAEFADCFAVPANRDFSVDKPVADELGERRPRLHLPTVITAASTFQRCEVLIDSTKA
jgi:hypothetical protein